jgi:toxin YhaV
VFDDPIVVNGWTIYMHPLFGAQYTDLKSQVAGFKRKNPHTYEKQSGTKRLAAIHKLVFEIIPEDPSKSEYKQEQAYVDDRKHWLSATFFQQYRLFFRYHEESKIIVYTWVDHETPTLSYDNKTDTYKTFAAMLAAGNPPDSWDTLLQSAFSHYLSSHK